MSITLTEQEFRDLGFAVDPGDPSRAVAASPQDESLPDDSWDLDRLGVYAAAGLSEANRLQRESIQLGRKSTVEIYRAGRAISLARKKIKAQQWGAWGQWLVQHKLKRTTAWEAAALYERAESEDAIKNLTPDEAKNKYNITRRRQNRKPPNSQSPSPPRTSESASNPAGAFDNADDFDANDAEEPFDGPEPEPEELVRPPRTVITMLSAADNLLLACEERSSEFNETSKEMLVQIAIRSARLLEKLSGAVSIETVCVGSA